MLLVTAALIVSNGKVLAARRASNRHLAGLWEFPGGKVEIGESPEQCLARELCEEFEVESSVGEFFMESTYHYEEKSIRLLAYWVTLHSRIDKMNDHDQICWLAPNCLQELTWSPADQPIVEAIQGGGNELLVGKSKPDIQSGI